MTSELENSLLIADPSLRDGLFDRSVIHLAEHSLQHGAIGYILNKPTDKKVGDVLTAPMFTPLKNIPIFFGGPVNTDQIVFSVYWWKDDDHFEYRLRISAEEAATMKRSPGSILVAHVGHSGWSPGQLEEELKEQAWINTPVSSHTLSVPHRELWRSVLEGISPYHKLLSLTPIEIENN